MKVSQQRVYERGTRAECKHCTWRLSIRDAGTVSGLRAESMRHVCQTGHTVRRYVEDITEYAPDD